jgi:hypothetical protein
MPKVSVVDISDGNKIQELVNDGDDTVDPDNDNAESVSSDDSDEELGVVPRLFFNMFSTLTMLVPLVSVHIALDILVHQQYSQDFDVVEIASRAGTAAIGTFAITSNLVLLFLIGGVHPRKDAPILRGGMFCTFLALGVAMIRVSRDGSYYAVMV